MTNQATSATTTSGCAAMADLLAALSLGSELDPAERDSVLDHLAVCPHCRRRLAEYAEVAQILPLAAPAAEPPPELRARILAAATGAPAPVPTPAPRPAPRGTFSWRTFLTPALGLACALLLALGLSQLQRVRELEGRIAQQQQQSAANLGLVLAAFGNDDAVEATLAPTALAPDASGRVFVSPGEPALAIYARGLPPLPPEQQYQVWVTHAGGTVSAGRLPVNAEGRGWRPLSPPEPLGAIERVFVTVEPASGSAAPTGAEYLTGAPGS